MKKVKIYKSIFLATCISLSQNSFSMLRALNTAASGMSSMEANVNTISNNIANVNTTAYKQQRAEFEDLVYETVQEAGGRSSNGTSYTVGVQIGSGSKLSGTKRIYEMGSANITNRPYDLMIMGDGFFGLQMGDSVVYTRDGSFTVDSQGIIKSRNGHPLLPNIQVPSNTKSLNVSEDGRVQAYLSNNAEPVDLGQIPIFTFVNPAGLHDLGGNVSRRTLASGEAIQLIAGSENSGTIMQGALESSNVSVMNEMTNLIKAQRAYEMNSKVMGVADQMLQTVNNIR